MFESGYRKRGVGLLLAVTLGLAACSTKGSDPSPDGFTNLPGVGTTASPRPAPQCEGGRLAKYERVAHSKKGSVFRVTGVEGADCAPIYDGYNLRTYGNVAVGDLLTSNCWRNDKPPRLRAIRSDNTEDIVGDVSLTNAGVATTRSYELPVCNPNDSDQVFIYPHNPKSSA